MTDWTFWPPNLCGFQIEANIVPFTRSGGKSLGGIERTIRTDRGHWKVARNDIVLRGVERRRAWNAIRTQLGGRSGLIALPVYSGDTAPLIAGTWPAPVVPHSDGSTFGDGTGYLSSAIEVRMHSTATIGATVVNLRIVTAAADLAGVRFSYQHALYETGPAISVDGGVWQVPIFPAIRAAIPAGARLEFDRPTCLMRLASDDAMDVSLSRPAVERLSVAFTEAVDYWSDLALT